MPDRRLLLLIGLFLASTALFLCWNLSGRIWFILELRAVKLAALALVGAAVGASTVLFQTISGNRILTPAIMGFDALYLLLQTLLVFFVGGLGYVSMQGTGMFLTEALVMVGAALALFGTLLARNRNDIQLMLLAGIVLGLMFRSLTSLMQRMMDPSEFAMVQGAMFASFGGVDRQQLAISAGLALIAAIWIIRLLKPLDVVALGRGPALSLGLSYDSLQRQVLIVVSLLVSVSTALVGPITFLGLLVASFAHSLMRSHRHALLIPAAALIAATVLVLGQAMFERIFRLQSSLAILIEFLGGLFFLYLLARGRVR